MASILYFISYCYDVLDGNYARKYKMVSKFGDYYDHFKDVSVNIIMFYMFYKYTKYKNRTNLILLIVFITVFLFMFLMVNIGCKEVYSSNNNKDKSEFLSFSKRLCTKRMYSNLNSIRYLGTGLFSIWISFLIFLNKFF